MEDSRSRRSCSFGLVFFPLISCLLLLLVSFPGSVDAYKNYTVGDSLGWYDNLLNPNVNYQKWVAGKNFSLGDFLIFNTDNNHSVIQTSNFTTYKLCDYDNASENDTVQWSTADPSSTAPHSMSVAVPLLNEGMTYFFSGDYDGEQCQNGQHFKINVIHGQGLPESLKNPSEESPGPNSPDSGDDESAPDTVISSDFNHPKEESEGDKQESGSVSLYMKLFDWRLNGVLIMSGFVCMLF